MKDTYQAFRLYLYLLYSAFFNWTAIPEVSGIEECSALIFHGVMAVVVATDLIWANFLLLSLSGIKLHGSLSSFFDWTVLGSVIWCIVRILFGGTILGVAYGVASSRERRFANSVAVGMVGGVSVSVGILVSMKVTGMIAATALIAVGMAFGASIGVAAGLASGVALSASGVIAVGMAVTMGFNAFFSAGLSLNLAGNIEFGVPGWRLILAIIVLSVSCLWITFRIAELVDRLSQSNSVQTDWLIGLGLAISLSIGTGYLLSSKLSWYALHPLITAAIIVLCYTRLPLWPFEAIWGLGVIWWQSRSRTSAESLSNAIFKAYFDRQTILPLPGELRALRRLADLESNLAMVTAALLAESSGHLLTSVTALQTFAASQPMKVRTLASDISNKRIHAKLVHYVNYGLSPAPALVWETQERLNKLINKILEWEFKQRLATTISQIPPGEREQLFATLRGERRKSGIWERLQVWLSLKKWRLYLKTLSRRLSVSRGQNTNESEEKNILTIALNSLRQNVYNFELAQQLNPALQEDIAVYSAVNFALLQAVEAQEITAIGAYTCTKLPANIVAAFAAMLSCLDQIAAIVRSYLAATSPVTQRDFLLRANKQLEELAQDLDSKEQQKQPVPLSPLLNLIVDLWRMVIATEGGELAQEDTVDPVANPYVIGNPVRGELLVGRDEILRQLEELWAKEGQCSSVVLFGHRRMGKSSILQNLGDRFGAGTIIVNFNMENYGWAQNNGELLFNLALQLYDSWCDSGHNELAEPDEGQFLNHNPYMAFNRFLTCLDRVVKGERFIITVDEFEIIEEGINEARFDSYLLRYWRGTFQNYPWFIMAFAGLHNLEEMCKDYWHPLYSSVRSISVSFLSPKAARRLITRPNPNFAVDYDSDAIEQIIKLTNGQPYLVQLICHTLITRFNRQTFEEGIERERRFTFEDVEAVINAPEFYRDGNAYFNGVWVQAETSEPTGQVDILKALSRTSLSLNAIADKTGLNLEEVQAALETLKRHDVIEQRDEQYVYTVELMRRWVERQEGS